MKHENKPGFSILNKIAFFSDYTEKYSNTDRTFCDFDHLLANQGTDYQMFSWIIWGAPDNKTNGNLFGRQIPISIYMIIICQLTDISENVESRALCLFLDSIE